MNNRARKLLLLSVLALGGLAATAIAGVIVYTNGFNSQGDLQALRRVLVPGTGTHCKRALSAGKLQVTVGKSTTECDYATQVNGSSGGDGGDFDISATVALAPGSKLTKKTFLSVGLRLKNIGGGAGKYRLDVSPAAQRFALRRYDGAQKAAEATGVFAAGKRSFIKKHKPNKIRLKVYNSGGSAVLLVKINGNLIGPFTDVAPLAGHGTLIAMGRAAGSDHGAIGTFDNLIIRTAP